LRNHLALHEIPFFDKNIKTLVKKRLEEKSWVLIPQAGLPIQYEMYPIEKGCDQIQTSSL
jgi:hypothetical protein